MAKLGKIIPSRLKQPLVNCINRASNIVWVIYVACQKGKLYCPDKLFQKWDYWVHSHDHLNLKDPKTFQDKLQWLKYYNRHHEYTKMVDKAEVGEWVSELVGDKYLIKTLGVYDKFDEINFQSLPEQFIIKCTHDSGSYVICKDKAHFDIKAAKIKLEECLKRKQFYLSREWPYKNVKPRLIIQELLVDESREQICDYKFMCFGGKVKICYVISDRNVENGQKENFYTPDWEMIPMRERRFENDSCIHPKPKKLKEMIDVAEKLSQNMPFLRVDFFYVNEKIYFAEVTFFDNGGRQKYIPDEMNTIMGDWIKLPPKHHIPN